MHIQAVLLLNLVLRGLSYNKDRLRKLMLISRKISILQIVSKEKNCDDGGDGDGSNERGARKEIS